MPRPVALFIVLAVACSCKPGCRADEDRVMVLAAASLARAFGDLEEQLEAARPRMQIDIELSGSQVACRKIAELNRRADVVATADPAVIDAILRPRFADFTIRFATNELVLAHAEHSRHTEEVSAKTWPQVLQRPGVRLGFVDPDLAPIGYRTLLAWKLAERALGAAAVGGPDLAGRLRARAAPEHVVPHEGELLQLLQTRAIDYAFVYRSTAEEHNLKLVPLPDTYNLGAAERAGDYAKVSVPVRESSGAPPRQVRGAPMVYGVTIPKEPLDAAAAAWFVEQLLGAAGQRALERTGFRVLRPATCDHPERLPASVRALVR